jgi:hypothetical protein
MPRDVAPLPGQDTLDTNRRSRRRAAESDVAMLRERPALTRAAGVQTSRHVTPMSQLSAAMGIWPSPYI